MPHGDNIDDGNDRQASRGAGDNIAPDRDGLENLAKSEKERRDSLKHGARSGITDEFGKPVLIAENYKETEFKSGSPLFKLGARTDEWIDSNGVSPFGARAAGGVSDSQIHSTSYYSTTLGFRGSAPGGITHEDVCNVNISDGLKVNGKSILDGHPHRQVFPLKHEEEGAHWNWIDATVQASGGLMQLTVHRVSASDSQPVSEKEWDDVNLVYKLKHQKSPQHAPPDQYWLLFRSHQRDEEQPGTWRNNFNSPVLLREKQ